MQESVELENGLTGGEEQNLGISSDLIRGHINTIILRSLYDGDKYGYDIINEIEKKSGGLYSLKQPTLYSALKRLESLQYVKSYYGEFSNGGRRKYFTLTDLGRKVTEQNLSEWEYSRTIIDSLISDGNAHYDFSFITDKQKELVELKETLASRERALEEEKTALGLSKNELQRERALLSTQSSSLNSQKSDFKELKDKVEQQRQELEEKELALHEKQGEIGAKELELKEKEQEIEKSKSLLESQTAEIYTLKGLLEQLFDTFGMTVSYARSTEPYLHPGRQAVATCDGTAVAVFGELHPDTADAVGIGTKAYVAQIELSPLFASESPLVLYKPLPRFPAVERDLALLCDAALPAAEIEATIRLGGGKLLEDVKLFDVYQGSQIEAGKKSVAYSLWFRSSEGTLSDADIEPALNKIFKKLEEKGCTLRS